MKHVNKAKIYSIPKKEFEELIKLSISRSDILFKLRMRKSGSANHILNRRIKEENIDVSHFKLGCQKGENKRLSNEEVYVENSKHKHIRYRFLSDKIIDYVCGKCGLFDTWQNEPLTLELDHINGNRYDNRVVNLRWLCPNCHSQTKTFCRKRRV